MPDADLNEIADLRWVGAIVSRDGEVEETGLGAGVLNDPVEGIVWLVIVFAIEIVVRPGAVSCSRVNGDAVS